MPTNQGAAIPPEDDPNHDKEVMKPGGGEPEDRSPKPPPHEDPATDDSLDQIARRAEDEMRQYMEQIKSGAAKGLANELGRAIGRAVWEKFIRPLGED
ncbi:hypothetical protein SAMN05443575_1607 [Jatrophihabitans endophyticus]|uniref:Uncharacterized protein n=1 Tax=Jatrophihabitans endophyticus TaxID=1206085 RepID=A0A1M5HR41_9ACTN|nr:hypothetical protein [Jatrophihabitans endophyticus]SHG18397.1 hypothetical protein SAMN05443575_1607 [Jatrophihabitans endophyticus]